MNQNKSVKIRFKGFTEAWEQRKLTDLVSFYGGLTYKPTDVKSKGVLVLRSSNVKDGALIAADNVYVDPEVATSEKVKIGDIVMVVRNGSKALIGKHAEVKQPMADTVVGAFMVGLRSPCPSFANALLNTSDFDKEIAKNMGATINQLTGYMFKQMVFFMPGKEEQEKIGVLFSTLENTITLHQRKLNRFQKIRTTFLQKMFPKNGETKPAIRLTGFNADWEQEKLQNFAVRITRKNIKKQNNRPLTISAQHGLVDQTVYFNNRVAAQDVSNYYLIKKGEFAYNRSTSKDAPVGAVRRLVDYEEGVLSTLYLVFSITDPQHVDPNYLSYFFETTGWHSWILERAAEGARNHGLLNVSSQDFLSLPVMLPSSLEEQQKIGEFFQKIDDCIILLERQVDLLKQIKSSLLLNMFPPSNAE